MIGLPGARGDRGSPGPVGGLVSAARYWLFLFACTVKNSTLLLTQRRCFGTGLTSTFGCCLTSEFLYTLQGAPGSDGPAGPPGSRGASGNMGLPGMTGPQGEAGREVRITRPSTMTC